MPNAALRHLYERHGVEGYYAQFGDQYRNPHEQRVRAALHAAVAAWQPDLTRVLDLACGSGEATLALREVGAGDFREVGRRGSHCIFMQRYEYLSSS